MKRFFKTFLKKTILVVLLVIGLLYLFDYDYILKGIRVVYMTGHTTAYIDDAPHFDNRKIDKSNGTISWALHSQYNQIKSTERLNNIHKELGTVSFLVIKKDSIWHEKYADGYSVSSSTNSFSMAKSVVTALLGKAIMDGYISSLDHPVGDFLPRFSQGLASQLTVGDLSSMSSGLNWSESYSSPFSMTARAYYHPEIREQILELDVVSKPGKEYIYLSGNTQLLAMVLEKATQMNLSSYLSRSFWKPMGMEQDAYWQLDSSKSGIEKAYCCIASNARDFAKFGVLINNYGVFAGRRLLPQEFVEKATQPRFKKSSMYGYGFWLSNYMGKKIVVMRGILGQYVISIPEDDLVIVRLGHKRDAFKNDKPFTNDFYVYIDEVYKMLANAS